MNALSPNHWTAREFPRMKIFFFFFLNYIHYLVLIQSHGFICLFLKFFVLGVMALNSTSTC